MTKKLRIGLSVLLATCITLVGAGCDGASDSARELEIPQQKEKETKEIPTLQITMYASWYGEGWQAIEEDVNANAENLGFRLDFDKIAEGDQGVQVLKTRAAAGDLPDLLAYHGVRSLEMELRASDKAMDLSDSNWLDNYDEAILKSNFGLNGKVISVPLGGINLPGIFYNKQVFSELGLEVPTNWTEFLAVCEKLKEAGKIPCYVAGKDTWTTQILAIAGWQRDYKDKDVNEEFVKLITNKKNIVDYKYAKDSFFKLQELKDNGYIQETWLSDTYDGQQEAIVTGKAGMTCNATWMMDEIAKKYPEQMDDVGGFAPVFDGEDPVGAWIPNAVFGFTTSKHPEAVKAFLDYFASTETQNKYFAAQAGIPIAKGITVDTLPLANQEIYEEFLLPGRGQTLWQSAMIPSDITDVGFGDFSVYTMDALLGKNPDEILQDIRDFMEKDAKSKGAADW